jgi:hypothetical protein
MEYQKTCRSHHVVYYSVLCAKPGGNSGFFWPVGYTRGGEEHVSIVFIVDLKYGFALCVDVVGWCGLCYYPFYPPLSSFWSSLS